MADVFINGGTLKGTSAADTLWSRESEWIDKTQNWRITLRSGLSGLGGNDYLDNVVLNAKLNGGTGNDYIHNHAAKVTISGGKGSFVTASISVKSLPGFVISLPREKYPSTSARATTQLKLKRATPTSQSLRAKATTPLNLTTPAQKISSSTRATEQTISACTIATKMPPRIIRLSRVREMMSSTITATTL